MSGLSSVKPRELVRAERDGFQVVRKSRGSHWQMAHADGRRTTVPVKKGKDVGPGLLRKILRDVEMTFEELRALM